MLAALADGRRSGRAGLSCPRASRALLQRTLTAQGFRVNGIADAQRIYTEAKLGESFYGIVRLAAQNRDGFAIVRQLRHRLPGVTTVVTTDVDSSASMMMALRASADDYMATSADPPL